MKRVILWQAHGKCGGRVRDLSGWPHYPAGAPEPNRAAAISRVAGAGRIALRRQAWSIDQREIIDAKA